MPGTRYSREGPKDDPLGRLADFSRFAKSELTEIDDKLISMQAKGQGLSWMDYEAFVQFLSSAEYLAGTMEGFTTADD